MGAKLHKIVQSAKKLITRNTKKIKNLQKMFGCKENNRNFGFEDYLLTLKPLVL